MIFHKKSQVLRLFMWMLHDILKESQEDSSSHLVYVNVTWYILNKSSVLELFMWMLHAWYYKRKAAKFSDCLCECCMIFHKKSQVLRLFMWMLHDTLKESQEDSSSQIVYVNVTWYSKRESRRFKFLDCLCECFMIFHKKSQVLRLFMWMLHDIF
jgi:hypothetical protein